MIVMRLLSLGYAIAGSIGQQIWSLHRHHPKFEDTPVLPSLLVVWGGGGQCCG
jgi:hypothetical protein